MWTPIVGVQMNLDTLQKFIDAMVFDTWKPNGMVVHNTGAPSLKQWHQVPAAARIRNLTAYFRDQRGWQSGPHAFVADDFVYPFTPFNKPGTHSPSWNGTKLGIEMVGDFATEDPMQGPGLNVVRNTVALFGMLHRKLGIDPATIRLHKEDPNTTHDCPGKHFDKAAFIESVKNWMNHGGDHHESDVPAVVVYARTPGDTLNLRDTPAVSGKLVATLKDGTPLTVLGKEMNRSTVWLRVEAPGHVGWVSAQFTKGELG